MFFLFADGLILRKNTAAITAISRRIKNRRPAAAITRMLRILP